MPRVDHDAFCVEFYSFFLIRTIFCVKLSINNHIVGLVHKNHIIRTRLMYHAACKVEFQPFKRLYSQLQKKHGTRADDILCKTEYWSQSYRRFSSQKPYNTNVSDVPRSLQSWISTIQTVVLTADVFQLFIKKLFIKKNCWESKCWGVTEPRLEKESSRAGASDQKGGNCAQLKWHNREKETCEILGCYCCCFRLVLLSACDNQVPWSPLY